MASLVSLSNVSRQNQTTLILDQTGVRCYNDLPLELIQMIFSHLSNNLKDLANASRVSKQFNSVLGTVLVTRQEWPHSRCANLFFSRVIEHGRFGTLVVPTLAGTFNPIDLRIVYSPQALNSLQMAMTKLPKLQSLMLDLRNIASDANELAEAVATTTSTTLKKLTILGRLPANFLNIVLAQNTPIEELDLSRVDCSTPFASSSLKTLRMRPITFTDPEPYMKIFKECPKLMRIWLWQGESSPLGYLQCSFTPDIVKSQLKDLCEEKEKHERPASPGRFERITYLNQNGSVAHVELRERRAEFKLPEIPPLLLSEKNKKLFQTPLHTQFNREVWTQIRNPKPIELINPITLWNLEELQLPTLPTFVPQLTLPTAPPPAPQRSVSEKIVKWFLSFF